MLSLPSTPPPCILGIFRAPSTYCLGETPRPASSPQILAFDRTDIVSEGPLCSWPRPLSHQAPSIPPSASRRSCSQFLYYAAAGRRRCLSRTFLGETYRGHERFVRTLSSRLTLGLARRVV